MAAAVPADLISAGFASWACHQPQIGLVDQGRGLQGLARLRLGEALGRKAAQLIVNDRPELSGSGGVASLNGGQDVGHVTHRRYQGVRFRGTLWPIPRSSHRSFTCARRTWSAERARSAPGD